MSGSKYKDVEGTSEAEELDGAYSIEYLAECADGNAREERIEELRRRIEAGAYRVDADWVAQELLSRGDLDSE